MVHTNRLFMTNSRKTTTMLGFLFVFLLMALPWMLGGNLPWVRTSGLAVCGLFGLLLVLYPPLLGAPTKVALMVGGLLIAGVAYGAFQQCPDFESTASFYPAATRERVCELILGVGVFLIASSLFTNHHFVPWLFGLITLNGALLTFLGISQRISGSDKIYWVYELIHGGEPFGPFVNGNNAGGYLLMCFAAANFFLARKIFQSPRFKPGSDLHSGSKPRTMKKNIEAVGRAFAGLQLQQMYVLAAIVMLATGVIATMSRGAAVALVVGTLAGWMFLFKRSWTSVIVTLVIMSAGFGVLVFTEQSESVVSNLESLSDIESAAERRVEHWTLTLDYAKEDLVFGHGMGTHSLLYPSRQTTPFKRWFKHAENQYLETLAEMGVVGLALLLGVIGLLFWASINLLSKPDSNSRAIGVTAIICLTSQAIAAFLDFGLYQPANMCLMATLCGIVFAQHNWFWSAQNVTRKKSSVARVSVAWLYMFLLVGSSGWAVCEYSAVDARRTGRRFNERFDGTGSVETLKKHQQLLEYATERRPDDAFAHYELALNHILQFRLEAAELMLNSAFEGIEPPVPPNPATGNETASGGEVSGVSLVAEPSQELQPEEPASNQAVNVGATQAPEPVDLRPKTIEEAWELTKVSGVHRLAHMNMQADPKAFEALASNPPVSTHLAHAWKELVLAEQCCDRLWMTQLRLGQLACLMGEGENERQYLAEAVSRCPNDASLLFMIGLLEHQAGETDLAAEHWNRCLTLTRKFETPIIRFCRFEMGMDVVKEQVLPTNPYFRLRIAKKYFSAPEDLLLKRWLLNHTKSVLDQYECDEGEKFFIKGEIERAMGNFPIASVYFRKALEKDDSQTSWRIGYARSLMEEGYLSEAIAELTKCQFHEGSHMIEVQRLLRRARKLRTQQIRETLDATF